MVHEDHPVFVAGSRPSWRCLGKTGSALRPSFRSTFVRVLGRFVVPELVFEPASTVAT